MPQKWIIHEVDEVRGRRLASEAGLHPVVAGLLLSRGICSADEAKKFLEPKLSDIPDPFSLSGMEEAASRIADAFEASERIAIFGDYDADGVTATAILSRFFAEAGFAPLTSLPSRFGEGYGLTSAAVDDLKDKGVTLIVTVDNGTRAFEAISHARAEGVDVVVTDHHDVGSSLPDAVAVVNPKREGSPGELLHLCGAGVAFMLTMALRKRLRERNRLASPEPNIRQHLDLVAIGAIADSVELVGANRIFAKHGLVEIARSKKSGIRALIEVAGSRADKLTPGAVAFQLAPRINAAGRLSDAGRALKLMLSDDESESSTIARELDAANRERQAVEERIVTEAMSILAADPRLPSRSAIVLSSDGWHVGVVGIVAAKIAQRFCRPAVVITRDSRPPRGSARSFTGINMVEALSSCGDLLVKFGGHAMAAGLSVEESSIEAFTERFDEACAALAPLTSPNSLSIDARVSADELTEELAAGIASMGPFGAGNPEPVLMLDEAEIVDRRIVGNGHLKLKLKSGGLIFNSIGFGMADSISPEARSVSAAFTPELNTWQGMTSLQLKLCALKPASE